MKSLIGAWTLLVAALGGSPQILAIDGTTFHPRQPSGAANVLLFVSTDCPISNGYAAEIQRLCAAYAARGLRCALVYEDPDVDASVVRKHLDEYRYRGLTAAIDAGGSLAAQVRATVTPQAVVVDRRGIIRYSGRIDNLYEALGRQRRVVTAHDLENALRAIVDGKAPPVARTEPVGCYIVPPLQRPPSPRLRRPRRH